MMEEREKIGGIIAKLRDGLSKKEKIELTKLKNYIDKLHAKADKANQAEEIQNSILQSTELPAAALALMVKHKSENSRINVQMKLVLKSLVAASGLMNAAKHVKEEEKVANTPQINSLNRLDCILVDAGKRKSTTVLAKISNPQKVAKNMDPQIVDTSQN